MLSLLAERNAIQTSDPTILGLLLLRSDEPSVVLVLVQ
jgi:hypothetical protein